MAKSFNMHSCIIYHKILSYNYALIQIINNFAWGWLKAPEIMYSCMLHGGLNMWRMIKRTKPILIPSRLGGGGEAMAMEVLISGAWSNFNKNLHIHPQNDTTLSLIGSKSRFMTSQKENFSKYNSSFCTFLLGKILIFNIWECESVNNMNTELSIQINVWAKMPKKPHQSR